MPFLKVIAVEKNGIITAVAEGHPNAKVEKPEPIKKPVDLDFEPEPEPDIESEEPASKRESRKRKKRN